MVVDDGHLEQRLRGVPELVGEHLLGQEREVGQVLKHRRGDPAAGVAYDGRFADLEAQHELWG